MDQVQKILERIKKTLLEMRFEEKIITNPYRSVTNYVYENIYCIPRYIKRLGFLIEYAHSYDEAKNHGHEDGDALPLELGEDAILLGLVNEIRKVLNNP